MVFSTKAEKVFFGIGFALLVLGNLMIAVYVALGDKSDGLWGISLYILGILVMGLGRLFKK